MQLKTVRHTHQTITVEQTVKISDYRGHLKCHSLFTDPVNFTFFIAVALVKEALQHRLRKVDILGDLNIIRQVTSGYSGTVRNCAHYNQSTKVGTVIPRQSIITRCYIPPPTINTEFLMQNYFSTVDLVR